MLSQSNPIRVLLVEDDPEDALLARRVLASIEQSSYDVEWVGDPRGSVAALAENRHDVALVDLRLGAASGLDVLREALARGTQVPVIILTGETAFAFDAEAAGVGAADYLLKDEITPAMVERAIRYAIATARRIGQRRRAEARLQESEARFRAVVQSAADVITILALDGTIVYQSPSVKRLLGYEPEEHVGRNAFDFVHPDDRPQVQAAFAREVAQPTGFAASEYRFRHRDGSWRHLETTGGSLVTDPGGGTFVLTSRDVTERKLMEEELHRQLAILQGVTEGTTDAVFVKDLEGRYVFINSAGAAFLGRDRGEVLGRTNDELFSPATAGRVSGGNQRALAGETMVSEEQLEAAGSLRTWQAVRGPLRDSKGKIVGLVGVARDVTRQREAERELRERNELLQTVLDNIPAMVAIFGPAGDIHYVNATFTRALGYALPEARRIDLLAELYPAPDYRAGVNRFIREARGEWAEFRTTVRGGGVLDTTWANVLLSYRRSLGIGVDISARKADERRLSEAVQALEHAVEGIARLGPGRRFESVNAAFSRALGCRPEELLGREWQVAVHPDDRGVVEAAFERAAAEGRAQGNVRGLRADGAVFHQAVTLVTLPVDREGVAAHYLFVKDVGDQRRLESQLLQSQKMEAVGKLAGGIAHDFNNMLAVINGYSELVLATTEVSAAARGYVTEIGVAGKRAAELTRQLLAFSRKQLLEPKVLDLNQSLRGVDKMLRRLIGEDVELVTLLEPALVRVEADPGQIEQVIMNLAVNARDAMPRGGKLVLRTRNADAGEVQLPVEVPPGDYASLEVEDTGTGMTSEVMEHVFEPFFTTKERGQGTGLGLSTVYGIVKQSGGFIEVASTPGEGSCFRIFLPRARRSAEEAAQVALPELPAGDETILVCEDEPMVRTLVRRVLTRCGYTVLEATQVDDALRLAEEHPGEIHLLLTDVVMPRMSGRQLAERALAARPGSRVLFMTGYADDAVMRHGLETATVDVLQKPFTQLSLAQRVRTVLDRREAPGTRGRVLVGDEEASHRETPIELVG